MPVGLLDRAVRAAHGLMHPARRVAALRRGRGVRVLVDFLGAQVRKHAVAEIFEDQRLAAIANHDPVAGADFHFVHCSILRSRFPFENANPNAGARVAWMKSVSYTHLRAHETDSYLVCRLLLEKK